MTGSPRILVVDDEAHFLRALVTTLKGAGYAVDSATTGDAALTAAALNPPVAVVLDLMLPDMRGSEVCRELRQWSSVPIIVVSALDDEREKVAALDAGADDYVTKPFGVDELLARLRAVMRRGGPSGTPVVTFGDLQVDLDKRTVSVRDTHVHLTPREFALLRLFVQNEGRLLTHRTLLHEVWGPGHGDDANLLHVYISQLRRKIESDPARPRYVLNEPGAGYRFVGPRSASFRESSGFGQGTQGGPQSH